MLEDSQPEKPAVLVLSLHGGQVEKQVLAGIEEEGVPSVLERARGRDDAVVLANLAAERSSLSVGVGIDSAGRVCVNHSQLAEPLTELTSGEAADPAVARMLGHNAARIVVGVPLRTGVRS